MIDDKNAIGWAKSRLDAALSQLAEVVLGKKEPLQLALCCLIARGHLLIEDIPGVGKTMLANALARVLGLSSRRIQFTSDMLPADIIGNSIFDKDHGEFVFHPGPLFTSVVLADEVNRASPKTQSALLEAMEERQVSVEGKTHPLPNPFFVIATQNPNSQIGTFPLPESQLDRFLIRIELGYPNRDAERNLLAGPERRRVIEKLPVVIAPEEVLRLQQQVEQVFVSGPLREYILDLLWRSRTQGTGLSPRAGLALQRAAQAWALLSGRGIALPEDVQATAESVMAHRLSPQGDDGRAMAGRIIQAVPVT